MSKKITNIIVHCSASPWGCAREIRKWHTDPKPAGNGWSDIGYHFVIQNGRPLPDLYLTAMDGAIEAGRRLDGDMDIEPGETGIHALGYNYNSIGICLIGERRKLPLPQGEGQGEGGVATFSLEQMDSLKFLLFDLCRLYGVPAEKVLGHYETESGVKQGKTCPDFDMSGIRTWLKGRI